MAHTLTIGQVATTTGVAARTIRYYEQIGVRPVPRRTASGYRLYDEPAVERLRFVGRARSLRLPLQRLRTLTSTLNGGPHPALRPRLLALVQEQLSTVQHQIAELELLRRQLEEVSRRMLTSVRRGHTGPCRCLDTPNGTEHRPLRPAGRDGRPEVKP
jgi:DNA-binding transcriptional MerR regulator